MSSNEAFEKYLAAAPRQTLSAEAMQGVVSAMLAAESRVRRPWWRGRVSIWQAAAACVLVGVITFGLSHRKDTPRTAGNLEGLEARQLVKVDTPVFLGSSGSSYTTDITRWRVQLDPPTGATRKE